MINDRSGSSTKIVYYKTVFINLFRIITVVFHILIIKNSLLKKDLLLSIRWIDNSLFIGLLLNRTSQRYLGNRSLKSTHSTMFLFPYRCHLLGYFSIILFLLLCAFHTEKERISIGLIVLLNHERHRFQH